MLEQMCWYDIILMAQTYNEMMEENKESSGTDYNNMMANQQDMIKSQMSSFKQPSMPNMNSISSGIKMPKFNM